MQTLNGEELSNLEVGTTIYHINPFGYDFVNQTLVSVETIEIETNDGHLINEDASGHHFIQDMIRGNVKKTFLTKVEANKYLNLVHKGSAKEEVKEDHGKCDFGWV